MLEDQETSVSGGVCLLILCGIPGSGKTRLATSLLEQCNQPANKTTDKRGKPYFVHIEYDELLPPDIEREILTAAREDEQTEKSAWKSYRNDILMCVEALVKTTNETRTDLRTGVCLSHILDGVNKPDSVRQEVWGRFSAVVCRQTGALAREDTVCFIMDDNMYYRSMRYKYYQLARKYTVGFCQCCLVMPVDTAIDRNRGRQVMVDDNVIRAMEGRLEMPDGEIHSWEKLSVILNREEPADYLMDVINLVREASHNPVMVPQEVDWESRDRSREICSTSLHHQADQILRRIISQEMTSAKEKGCDTRELKDLANKLQERRRKLLHDLKTGVELVPRDLNEVKDDSKDSDSRLFEFIQDLFYGPKLT